LPELPEVETIKNDIAPYAVGHTIKSVEILNPSTVKQPPVPEFIKRVTGRKITNITRRGKYLFFHLDKNGIMMMHMKMTGSLLVNPESTRFSRAVLHLDKGVDIHFSDARKFGKMWLEKDESAVLANLGPEPIDTDFTVKMLAEIFKKRSAPVKAVLLDQTLIAGIGNMYADEALYEAKIHPVRPASSLKPAEIKRLFDAIRLVLNEALKKGGASVRDYVRPSGESGHAHDDFIVAHGTGNKCPRDGSPIERIVVRGRGTYYCPKCQKEP
jgi:formamidopyrimidine-DNA glycosylase